ncbi:DNA polymerase III subunit chi [Rhodopila sp.]|uniref:DNA polymerase III subunit chi n=1 Tax=Rhodopila sp. TaxID=2480087 RepID=UPI003D097861
MAEIGFYHLSRSTLPQVLPPLLMRTLAAGQRALVLGTSSIGLNALSTALWEQPAWLPHGTVADGDPDLQPIWLSTTPEPLNGARYLFLVDGAGTDRLSGFDRVFDLFDGTKEDALLAARLRWKAVTDGEYAVTYWQQTERSWQRKR